MKYNKITIADIEKILKAIKPLMIDVTDIPPKDDGLLSIAEREIKCMTDIELIAFLRDAKRIYKCAKWEFKFRIHKKAF